MKLGQLLALTVLSIFGEAVFAKAYAGSPVQEAKQRYLLLNLHTFNH